MYSLTGVTDFDGASVIAPNVIIVNNNPPDNNPAQLGNSFVFTLSGINIVKNIQGGNCGLPNQFNVATANVIYNNTDLGLAYIGVLDSMGLGLAIITLNIADMTCSNVMAPIINIQQ